LNAACGEGERAPSIFPHPHSGRTTIDEALVLRALAGAVAAGAITAAARKTRTLSESGQWAAFFTGIIAAAAGWWWAGVLILFFVSSSALTHWRAREKLALTEGSLPRGVERNASQVIANGGVFVPFAFAVRFTGNERWAYAALGALAAASSDTWSTEIGTLFGGTPRTITTGRPIEAGMSGGVSLAGFAAGVAGALAIALAGAFAIPHHHGRLAAAAAIGGFGGCLFDSLVGATLQATRYCDRCHCWTERRVHPCGYRTRQARGVYWMSNNVVNLACTCAGATISLLAGALMARIGGG
jgi:uncharacterized protein (TIGR00297 family)